MRQLSSLAEPAQKGWPIADGEICLRQDTHPSDAPFPPLGLWGVLGNSFTLLVYPERRRHSMTLTAKQEQFAQGIAAGLNQSDAYRAAYDASKTKPEVVSVKASQLMADGKVTVRVAELQAALADKQLWTRIDSVTELADIARGVESKVTDKIAAIKELNLMHGFNAPTKVELGGVLIHRIERVIVDPCKA